MNQLATANLPNDNINHINPQTPISFIPNLKKDLIDLLNGKFNRIDLMKFISQKGFFISAFNNLEEIKDQDADLYGKLIQIKEIIFNENFWDGMEIHSDRKIMKYQDIKAIYSNNNLENHILELQQIIENNKLSNIKNEYLNTYMMIGELLIKIKQSYSYVKDNQLDPNIIEDLQSIYANIIHFYNHIRTVIGNLTRLCMISIGNNDLSSTINTIECYSKGYQAINCISQLVNTIKGLNTNETINLLSQINELYNEKLIENGFPKGEIINSDHAIPYFIDIMKKNL